MSSMASWQAAHPALNTSIFRLAVISLVPSILALPRLNGRRWQRDARRYPLEVPPRSSGQFVTSRVRSQNTPGSGHDRNHTKAHEPPWIYACWPFWLLAVRPNSLSARVRNEAADLLRPRENHVGSIAHHTGSHEGRRALLRTIAADIGLEAQVAFPEIAHLPVRGGDLIGVAAMIDRLHALLRIELFQLRHPAAAHHHAAHLAAVLRGLGRMAGLRCLFEKGEQIGALARVFHTGKRHGVSRNEVLRVLDPFVERVVGPDDAGRFER